LARLYREAAKEGGRETARSWERQFQASSSNEAQAVLRPTDSRFINPGVEPQFPGKLPVFSVMGRPSLTRGRIYPVRYVSQSLLLYAFAFTYLQFHNLRKFIRSRDSVVGIATSYGLDDPVRVPVESKIFPSPNRPDQLWDPPNLLSGGSFPAGKAARA
jgi:hypothetical protein